MKGALGVGRSLHSRKYRADIDGIRAIAVGSVVLCHAFPTWLPGGFVGVDIFFVISGYLITGILLGDLENDRYSILQFYNRRIKRIFPALVATLAFTVALGWYCLFRPEFLALGRHIVASTLFFENFRLWFEAGYFDVDSELKPTLHLWSLAIEEQFYIVWPLLMAFAHRFRLNYLPLIGVLALLSFGLNIYEIHHDPSGAYYSPLGRSWELMIGSALAYVMRRHPDAPAPTNAMSVIGIALIGISMALVGPDSEFPGFWALPPTIGSALLLASGEGAWVNRLLLARSPMVWIGLISYPLYLWHWPLLSFGHILVGPLSPFRATLLVVAAVIAATGTFLIVERPFRRPGAGPKPAFIALGGMVLVLACGALMATGTILPRLKGFSAPDRTEWDFLLKGRHDTNANVVGIYPVEAERPGRVLFIGDSHLSQYAERIARDVRADPAAPGAVLAIGGQCIPIEGVTVANVRRSGCWPMRAQAFAMAMQPRTKAVVIGGNWNMYFFHDTFTYAAADGSALPLVKPAGRAAALDALGRQIHALVAAGKPVTLLLDNPMEGTLSPTGISMRLGFSARNYKPNSTTKVDPEQRVLNDQIRQVGERAGARVIDPAAAVCQGDVCRVTDAHGLPIFKDNNHFNPDWVIANADFIDPTVQPR